SYKLCRAIILEEISTGQRRMGITRLYFLHTDILSMDDSPMIPLPPFREDPSILPDKAMLYLPMTWSAIMIPNRLPTHLLMTILQDYTGLIYWGCNFGTASGHWIFC